MQWPTAERKIREQQRCSIRPAAVDLVSMVLGFDYNRDLPSVLIQVVYNIAYALLTVPVVVIFVASHFGMHLQLKERLKRVAENMLLLVLSFGVWVGCSAFVLLFPILKDAIRGSKYELILELIYVTGYSSFLVTGFRALVGLMERYVFVSRLEKGDTDILSVRRVICFLDLYFDVMRWTYFRLVFAKLSIAANVLTLCKDYLFTATHFMLTSREIEWIINNTLIIVSRLTFSSVSKIVPSIRYLPGHRSW